MFWVESAVGLCRDLQKSFPSSAAHGGWPLQGYQVMWGDHFHSFQYRQEHVIFKAEMRATPFNNTAYYETQQAMPADTRHWPFHKYPLVT